MIDSICKENKLSIYEANLKQINREKIKLKITEQYSDTSNIWNDNLSNNTRKFFIFLEIFH